MNWKSLRCSTGLTTWPKVVSLKRDRELLKKFAVTSIIHFIIWIKVSKTIYGPNFLKVLSTKNVKKILLWRSFFTFTYNRSTIWISCIFHIISLHRNIWTQQIDLAPKVWLHSSVGCASHRYPGGHRLESHWSSDIFQVSSFQLLKLENLLRWLFFTF